MFDSPILEVSIGLSYVFLILSLVATILVEGIYDWKQVRGRMLYRHLRRILGDELVAEFYGNKKVADLASGKLSEPGRAGRGWRRLQFWLGVIDNPVFGASDESRILITTGANRLPSYIPDGVFADVIIDWHRSELPGALVPPSLAGEGGRPIRIPPELLSLWNRMYLTANGEIDAMRQELINWFKASTDRLSGQYRRRARVGLFIVGALLVVVSNADAIYIAKKLYHDPQLRLQLVEASKELNALCDPEKSTCTKEVIDARKQLSESIQRGRKLAESDILGNYDSYCFPGAEKCPISADWRTLSHWAHWNAWTPILVSLLGWSLTVIAIGMGADFWFSTMQRLLNIGNAKKPALAQDSSQVIDDSSSNPRMDVQAPALQSGTSPLDVTDATVAGMRGFTGRLFRENPLNAFWLGQLASLAYSEPQTLAGSGLLKHLGISDPPGFFDKEGTQVYLIQHSDFAVAAFRGTEKSADDFLSDADFKLEECGEGWQVENRAVRLHAGFAKALDRVWPTLQPELLKCKTPIWFTGHSLGGALAVLAAYRYHRESKGDATKRSEIGGIYTYGQPRVGNQAFKDDFPARLLERMYRYVNDTDIVPQVPPPLSVEHQKYEHVGQLRYFDSICRLHTHPNLWDRLESTTEGLISAFSASSPVERKEALKNQLRAPLANHAIAKYIQALERDPVVRAQWATQAS